MATSITENNEWVDPYPILDEDREPSPKEQLTAGLQQELVSTYKQIGVEPWKGT